MSLAHKEVQSPILFQVKNFWYFFLSSAIWTNWNQYN